VAKSKRQALKVQTRAIMQSAKFAIRDIYDAIVELVTNSDDRYQILKSAGAIEIEVLRRRGKNPSILQVRDFADGMNADTMREKISTLGGRVSGLEKGELVRGTHSRGAKDVAALGRVVFESVAEDGLYHKCEITPFFDFLPPESQPATPSVRKRIGIIKGTGTVVTIELDSSQRVPQHENLKHQLCRLVNIREILRDDQRRVLLKDTGKRRKDVLLNPKVDGTIRIKESFEVPGYPGARAKIIISRAKKRFENESQRFRLGGIFIISKHAVHEATLFDSGLESNPHALWFYGKLVCPYIDDLCNEYDDCFEAREHPKERNPIPPLDPSRRSGLTRDHPFVKALFAEALKRLRPLVEEERKREESERASIESRTTRKRLNALEKAATDFLRDFGEEDKPTRDPDGKDPESRFRERGYALTPPFTQIVAGHSQQFWLTILQESFPEIEASSTVQVECLSSEVVSSQRFCVLEPHPVREGVLRAMWKVKGLKATPATGVRARVGPINAESMIEVFTSEADKYSWVEGLCFNNKRYRIRTDQKRKKLRILAPLDLVKKPVQLEVSVDSRHFSISGDRHIRPVPELDVAICEVFAKSDGTEDVALVQATIDKNKATASLTSVRPVGADLSIKLEDIDLGNQRYRWRQNVLEIAGRHPSLRRYLGDQSQGFPGQESKHFRLLVAEVVSDAVCALLVRRNVQANPDEFEDADWDLYYAMYSKYMTQFLPTAHKLQCPEGK
jgi:hypothetical protein